MCFGDQQIAAIKNKLFMGYCIEEAAISLYLHVLSLYNLGLMTFINTSQSPESEYSLPLQNGKISFEEVDSQKPALTEQEAKLENQIKEEQLNISLYK